MGIELEIVQAANKEEKRLKKAIAERDDALSDLLDGSDWVAVQLFTGLSNNRCKKICEMKRFES